MNFKYRVADCLVYSTFFSIFCFSGFCTHTKPVQVWGSALSIAFDDNNVEKELRPVEALSSFKMWGMGHYVIEEIYKTFHHTDSTGKTKIFKELAHYTIVNVSNGTYQDYANLSDTAIMLRDYTNGDSKLIYGMNFFNNSKSAVIGLPKVLSDTLIDNVNFKRKLITAKIANKQGTGSQQILYYRPDLKGCIFDFAKSYGLTEIYPITRCDYVPSSEKPFTLSIQISFLSDTLSPEMLKVFDKWIDSDKKLHPSKK